MVGVTLSKLGALHENVCMCGSNVLQFCDLCIVCVECNACRSTPTSPRLWTLHRPQPQRRHAPRDPRASACRPTHHNHNYHRFHHSQDFHNHTRHHFCTHLPTRCGRSSRRSRVSKPWKRRLNAGRRRPLTCNRLSTNASWQDWMPTWRPSLKK